jgi:hypothetical protein
MKMLKNSSLSLLALLVGLSSIDRSKDREKMEDDCGAFTSLAVTAKSKNADWGIRATLTAERRQGEWVSPKFELLEPSSESRRGFVSLWDVQQKLIPGQLKSIDVRIPKNQKFLVVVQEKREPRVVPSYRGLKAVQAEVLFKVVQLDESDFDLTATLLRNGKTEFDFKNKDKMSREAMVTLLLYPSGGHRVLAVFGGSVIIESDPLKGPGKTLKVRPPKEFIPVFAEELEVTWKP